MYCRGSNCQPRSSSTARSFAACSGVSGAVWSVFGGGLDAMARARHSSREFMPRKAKKIPPPPLAVDAAARARFRQRIGAWFQEHGRDLPWRRTRDPYAILVSELLLHQTQVTTVKPYFERWLVRFPDFAALAAAAEADVLHAWQGLGYYAR